ncbi:MAG: alpha/beta hydrolase [Candidatus Helarchaeota archaeon]
MMIPLDVFLIGLLVCGGLVFIIVFIYVLTTYHSKPTYCESIQEEIFTIPIDSTKGQINLEAKYIKSKFTPQQAPCVIVCHGWGRDLNGMKYIQDPLALQGYVVIAYSSRGHGKSGGNRDFPEIHEDIIKVMDYLEQHSEFGIDPKRIAVIGHSLGGNTALLQAYQDERVKVVIAISAVHDVKETFEAKRHFFSLKYWIYLWLRLTGIPMKISQEDNQWASPRFSLNQPSNTEVFLIHARDDPFIDFFNFEKNMKLLNLPEDHTLVFTKGGHALFHLECMITSQVIKWLHDSL